MIDCFGFSASCAWLVDEATLSRQKTGNLSDGYIPVCAGRRFCAVWKACQEGFAHNSKKRMIRRKQIIQCKLIKIMTWKTWSHAFVILTEANTRFKRLSLKSERVLLILPAFHTDNEGDGACDICCRLVSPIWNEQISTTIVADCIQ